MASAVEVYQECVTLGVELSERCGDLLYDGPANHVTFELVAKLKDRKPELLALVRRNAAPDRKGELVNPIDAMYRRINQAMPQGVHLPEEFWCRLDPLQAELHAAWSAADAERVAKAVDRYEATVVKFFRNTLLAQNASDG